MLLFPTLVLTECPTYPEGMPQSCQHPKRVEIFWYTDNILGLRKYSLEKIYMFLIRLNVSFGCCVFWHVVTPALHDYRLLKRRVSSAL